MSLAQGMDVPRFRLVLSFSFAVILGLFAVLVGGFASYLLANLPVAAEKILEIQPAFSGYLESSRIAPEVDQWVSRDIFNTFTTEGKETITVSIFENAYQYQSKLLGVSIGHRDTTNFFAYRFSGTLEVKEGLLIVPVKRNTPFVIGLGIAVGVFFVVVLLGTVFVWYVCYKEYRKIRTYQLTKSA